MRQLLVLPPGTLLLFAIGLIGKAIESLGISLRAHHHYFPHIEYVLWAIILGLILSNLPALPRLIATANYPRRTFPQKNSSAARTHSIPPCECTKLSSL